MTRIALGISYQGTAYHGWQTQTGLPTIQALVEAATARVADHPVSVTCAGRTDRGVHALGQVVHFDTTAVRSQLAWLLGINSYLPKDVRVDWAREVNGQFDARCSAVARRYSYLIYNHPQASALWRQHTAHCRYPLNATHMQGAAHYLIGEYDFSSFRAVSCQAKTTVRELYQLEVRRYQHCILIVVTANAFLHHMVRNIVGVLISIGSGKRNVVWAQEVLLAKDRTKGAVTAPSSGLYLFDVFYPELFSIPKRQGSLMLDWPSEMVSDLSLPLTVRVKTESQECLV